MCFRQIITYKENYDWVGMTTPFLPRAQLLGYGYDVLAGDCMICSEAFSCLNDSFRTIQMVEWFIQDHSVAWMIHSGPFSCLNDSFRLLNKNRTFAQHVARRWITRMYNFQNKLQFKQIVIRWKIVQGRSLAWMIHSGPFRFLNDSFRTTQLLEWFIQDHSGAWMIQSGTCFEMCYS